MIKQIKNFLRKIKNILIKKITKLKIFFSEKPVSEYFGFDRGVPIDRYYIDSFIKKNSKYIKNKKVLEIGDDRYSSKFDCKNTVIGIVRGKKIKYVNLEKKIKKIGTFDCIICTQVLNYTFDIRSVICNLKTLLKKNGILLLTCSSTTRISNYDKIRYGDYWRFTNQSITKLMIKYFKRKNIQVRSHGNVSVCSKFLYGLFSDELNIKLLNYNDKNYPLIITCKIKK